MKCICASEYYFFYQSDKERCFYIDLGQQTVRFSFCQLLSFRQLIWSIRIENHFDADLNPHGFEIISLCNTEHLFILNTLEILDIKKLINEAFTILYLTEDSAVPSI